MRMRLFVIVAAAAAFLLPAAARAEDKAPSLVIKIKSIDGLIRDVKYIGELAGKGEELKQFDEMLKSFTNEQGLGGIDMKRPIGLYGSFSDQVQESPAVVLLPIADEKAFLQFLGNFEIKPEKGDDGVYTVQNIPNAPLPVTIYFRFENKYAYITVNDKGHIAKDKLLAPGKVLPDDDSVVSISARLADIPDLAKQLVLTNLENSLAQLKEKKEPNEPPAVTKLKVQVAEHLASRVKAVLTDGETVSLRFAIDQKKDDLTLDAAFKARAGSPLAKEMEAAGKGESLFAGLAGKDDAISGSLTLTLPEEVRKALAPAIDDAFKQAIEQEKDQIKQALIKAAFEKIAPTLKAGEIDGGISVRGPDANGHYTFVGGVRVKEGKGIETFLRDTVKNLPEKDKGKVTLDADSAGDVKIHKATMDNVDEDASKVLGSPTVYFAVRDDAFLVGLGPDGLAALKTAIAAKPGQSKVLNVHVAVARAVGLNKKDDNAAKVAKEVFGNNPAGSDSVAVTAEMSDGLKFRVVVKGKVVALGVKAGAGK